ncbi:MAG: FAD-dependent oxidoreductase, partial [Pseudomonadota bacterium]
MIDRRDVLKVMGGGLVAGLIPWRSARAAAGGHQPVGYLRTNWRNDPFSLGSYSYIAKGATRRDIRALAKPVDNRLFFAGEATHPKYNSTVHAAFESGLIAAEQILPLSYEHVAVVGAGMSGLAAAHRLREAGVNIHVFEARDRIGGRMNTDHSLGTPLDLGASWIHGINNNPLYDMATELDLELLTTDGSYISRGKNGRKIPDNELPSWLENVTSVQHDAGADIDQINLLAYARDRDYT